MTYFLCFHMIKNEHSTNVLRRLSSPFNCTVCMYKKPTRRVYMFVCIYAWNKNPKEHKDKKPELFFQSILGLIGSITRTRRRWQIPSWKLDEEHLPIPLRLRSWANGGHLRHVARTSVRRRTVTRRPCSCGGGGGRMEEDKQKKQDDSDGFSQKHHGRGHEE